MPGEHHVAVRFTGMTLYDDTGAATYDGPTSFGEAGPALRSMVPELAAEQPRYVTWGEGTSDEMCLGIVQYTDS